MLLTFAQLADLGNLTQPWSIDMAIYPKETTWKMLGFKNSHSAPLPLEDIEREYCRYTSQSYPIEGMVFVRSWMLFRVCQTTNKSVNVPS